LRGFEQIRNDFPAARESTYLDIGTRNPLSNTVRTAIETFLDEWQSPDPAKEQWYADAEETREMMAELVNASADEVAFTLNTSNGLSAVASSIDWSSRDNVIVAPDVEHPNNLYGWLHLSRQGVDVRIAEAKGALVLPGDIERLADTNTRLVAVTSVSNRTGGRMDLKGISRVCKDIGAILAVDAVQSLGAMEFNVDLLDIDMFSAATNKSLLGAYGLGILYCRRDLIDELQPRFLARSSVMQGEDIFSYRIRDSARRFELGNYNFLGIRALRAGLKQIGELEVPNIQAHLLQLSRELTGGLDELGFRVRSSLSEAGMSHLVVFSAPRGVNRTDRDIADHLKRNGVMCKLQSDGIRLSLGVYNNRTDVKETLRLLK